MERTKRPTLDLAVEVRRYGPLSHDCPVFKTMYRLRRSLFSGRLVGKLAQSHDVVKPWRLEFIPEHHRVVDCVATRVSLDHDFNYFANSSVAYELRHLLEVGMLLTDAVISKVLLLDDSVTDDQFLSVAFVKAHSAFSGKPLGGTNSPPWIFSCSASERRRTCETGQSSDRVLPSRVTVTRPRFHPVAVAADVTNPAWPVTLCLIR